MLPCWMFILTFVSNLYLYIVIYIQKTIRPRLPKRFRSSPTPLPSPGVPRKFQEKPASYPRSKLSRLKFICQVFPGLQIWHSKSFVNQWWWRSVGILSVTNLLSWNLFFWFDFEVTLDLILISFQNSCQKI